MDFSPAILKEAPTNELEGKNGHPIYYHCGDPGSEAPLLLSLFVVMGKDFDGNTWLSCVMPRRTWPKLLEYLGTFEQ
jgi:hypothetical protein